MPDLDSLLDAVGQIRNEYQPKILEARQQARIHTVKRAFRSLMFQCSCQVDVRATLDGNVARPFLVASLSNPDRVLTGSEF
jgi:hypothetical protein